MRCEKHNKEMMNIYLENKIDKVQDFYHIKICPECEKTRDKKEVICYGSYKDIYGIR